MLSSRGISKVIRMQHQPYCGVQAQIIIDNIEFTLNPFAFWINEIGKRPGGLSDHPHRNMEGIIYTIEGAFIHEDSTGNHQIIQSGDLVYINSGKGIIFKIDEYLLYNH